MTEKLEILVVEDQLHHLADVRVVLDSRKQYGIESDYVSTLDGAKRKLEEKRYDGILSDVFFPEREGEEESASGLWIAEYGIQNAVPYVLVTSTWHHGSKTEPINRWCVDRDIPLVDWQPPRGEERLKGEEEGRRKNWDGGFLALMCFVEGVNDGLINIDTENYGRGSVRIGRIIDKVNVSHSRGIAPSYDAGIPLRGDSRKLFEEVRNKYCNDLFS